ncbi:rab3 GTPase-activating protein catalytic subunit-like [Gigantopelta aegis]|uniref:rab3 GTPase-activating protein catalytic subunit-like n=1 Tax=Gigantopelta aegis TaxID=1735272 RepID=UPI001B88C720|nr:rab3 GTPase-activating protein catalytic subunit-like [Gigantopelta aegis]
MADEDSDVFEITDFTTASEWERFIARLEEILHEWKLANRPPLQPAPKDEYTNGTWDERTDAIDFADFKFKIVHKYLKTFVPNESRSSEEKERHDESDDVDEDDEKTPTVFSDIMNLENDFPSRAHCLCRWFGLQEFIIISPAVNEKIDSESRSKLLLSSASVALNNTCCTVPVFIQVQQSWRKLYCGTCSLPGASVEFEMVHLKKTPTQYNHLAGLLDVFKSKLGCVYISMPPVSVSVRFTYILEDWGSSFWAQEMPDFNGVMEGEVGCKSFGVLPFGVCEDPVSDLNLSCTWPSLSEDMIVENHIYSDLDPLQAPQWSVRVNMTEDPVSLLGDYLREFLSLCNRKETTDELLGSKISEDQDKQQAGDISQVLQRLTEPTVSYSLPSLGNVVSRATARLKMKPEEAPIPEEMLNHILFFLFPDAQGTASKCAEAKEDSEDEDGEKIPETERYQELMKQMNKQMKSAPLDSLTFKLAVTFCIINHNHGGLSAVAHLWQEFILEMRYRWENGHLISGIEQCQPNLGTCLLHQKLQMLNCCIERKRKRESMGYNLESSPRENSLPKDADLNDQTVLCNDNSETVSPKATPNSSKADFVASGGSSSDDEFFECEDEKSEAAKTAPKDEAKENVPDDHVDEYNTDTLKQQNSTESCLSETFTDTVTHKPEGRLAPCKDLKLLSSGEPMYIPITQEPSPMTEDMLEEHAEVLAKLGSSPEGTQLRARMQSACLLSDMESFKAANPGCSLEDFVRWYSPRDFIEEEVDEDDGTVIHGCLSPRMQIPGNMWVEVWQSSRPVPARRQKRLFDDTKEAEKVLHFLVSLKPADVVIQLMPVLIHASIVKILENEEPDVPTLKTLVNQIVSKSVKLTHYPVNRKYEQLVHMIELAETVIARTRSLKSKFTVDMLENVGGEEELQLFVSSLLQQPEVNVRGGPCGPAGAIIHKLFVASQKAEFMLLDEEKDSKQPTEEPHKPASTVSDFPRASAREYILRAMVPRPAPYSRVLPQKMYCVLVDNDFRLAGAFSSDTTFQ